MIRAHTPRRRQPTFSFEFFPPASDAALESTMECIHELEALSPSFVSVTCRPGADSGARTRALVSRIRSETAIETLPHLTCRGRTRAGVAELLGGYAADGVRGILALAGDPEPNVTDGGEYRFAAELVADIQAFNVSLASGDRFSVGVAGFPEGHPATANRLTEIDHLKAKVDAGADWICTQLFFDNRDFYDFCERCELAGIRVPIVAGIMPVTSWRTYKRMAELAGGVRYPAALIRSLRRCGDDDQAVNRVGVHWATEQCRDLLDHGVDGIHFYTLNQSRATRDIFRTLGATCSADLAHA